MSQKAPQAAPPGAWRVDLADEAATLQFAAQVAEWLKADDLVTLSGDLGAGKTTFARGLLRHLCEDLQLEAPSPTFTLLQVYQGRNFPIVHADLYRIKDPDELAELGWEEASDGALLLVEWADRAGGRLPPDRLDIEFSLDLARGDGFRSATLFGYGAFAERLTRAKAVDDVLRQSGWLDARRAFMMGDASTRAYERLTKPDGREAVLMIMPARPPGPIIRFGKAYPAIAKLAHDIKPFLAVDAGLRAQGLSAPEIYGVDIAAGAAVLEDLGGGGVIDGDGPILERYCEAVAVLAKLHNAPLPETLPLPDGGVYAIPPYDLEAMLIEVEQMLEWYAPHVARVSLSSAAHATFLNIWRKTLVDLGPPKPTWILRDYHSPNLIWLEKREGLARVGLIDFQDCVLGHQAYDVAALLQDARVTVSDQMELRLLSHYARLRRGQTPGFEMANFARSYAVMGAQRNTKILGIFARLDRRDKKPAYLAHLPRIARYLAKDLAHPVLSEVKLWYETHVPQVFDRAA